MDPVVRLRDLETRHGELLDRLAELDEKINDVLAEWSRAREDFLAEQQKRNVVFDRDIEAAARGTDQDANCVAEREAA